MPVFRAQLLWYNLIRFYLVRPSNRLSIASISNAKLSSLKRYDNEIDVGPCKI